MLNRLRPLMALTAVLSLVACEPLCPGGYSKSPAMSEYFAKLAPTAFSEGVETVALCDGDSGRAATIVFKNGNLYHYTFKNDANATVDYRTTEVQRKNALENDEHVFMGCVGYYDYDGFKSYHVGGKYRIQVGHYGVAAHVRDSIVVNDAFDDGVKSQLKGAALALMDAVAREKKFVSAESTWGVKP